MISKTKLISKNIISLFLSFLILFTTSSTFVYAKTLDNADQSIDTIATELEFYFSKVGHFDKNNKYIITNPELLKEKANLGDDGAKKLYNAYINNNYLHNNYSANNYMTRGWFDFGKCVLISYLGPIYELLDGKYAEALGAQMASDSWRAAGKILQMALSEASKLAGKTVSGAFAVAELAYYAYQCKGEL